MSAAPVLEQQDARAVRTDQGDGEVGDARIADEQADIQRGDDAVQIVGQVDVGDGVVEDRHGREWWWSDSTGVTVFKEKPKTARI